MDFAAVDPTIVSVIALVVAVFLGALMYEVRNASPKRGRRDDYDWDI